MMKIYAPLFPSLRGLILALSLAACATVPPHIESLVVVAEAEANHSTATALDLVFVFDAKLLPLMPANSGQWFEQRAAFLAAAGEGIAVVAMQVPPATMANIPLPSKGAKALAVLVYAGYTAGAGQTVGEVTGHKQVEIRLAKDTVIYGGK